MAGGLSTNNQAFLAPGGPPVAMTPPSQTGAQVPLAAPDLPRMKRMFEQSRDLTQDARRQNLIDDDYYHSKQLTSTVKAALARRKQPDIVINRIKAAVNGTLGVIQRGKTEARCWPRTPNDTDAADVATDTLRFIAESNNFESLKLDVFKDILVSGTGAAIIEIDDDKQVTIQQIRWETFFYDPHSRRPDFKDAKYLGIAKFMYADDVAAMYPDKAADIERTVTDGAGGIFDESFADRPNGQAMAWVDRRNRRLMVVEIYYQEAGRWMRCVYHSGGIIEAGDSPYNDAKGKTSCPIEAQSAFVDRDNNRYGQVRDMRGPQDEINHRRSKALHQISTRQLQQTDLNAPSKNADAARMEAARPDGIIPMGYQVAPNSDTTSAQLSLLQEAKSEIERMGPNPAILGRDGADASGRALQARRESGLTELGPLIGGFRDWELRVYRQMWARPKQFWNDPIWIRVLDDDDMPKFIRLNEPQHGGGPPQVVRDPQSGQVTLQPNILGYKNRVAEMDVDIIIDTSDDTGSLQAETFRDLMQIVGSNPAYAAQVPFEVMLQLSPIQHKRALRDQIKAYREEQQKATAQAQQQAQQLAEAHTKSQIDKNSAEGRRADAQGMFTAVKAENEMRSGGVQLPVPMPAAGAQPGATG